MDAEFSPEQEEFRASVRRFAAERSPVSFARAMLDDPRGTTDEVWRGLADLGVTGLLVPEEHGGSGLGLVDMGVALEELGRVVHPGPLLSSAVTAVSLVVGVGTAADRAALLPGLAAGEAVGTLALLEPGRRWEWRQPATIARPDGSGGWVVDGVKTAVPDAQAATMFLVTASGELGIYAVDAGAPGVGVEPLPVVDGTRKQAVVTFTGAPARRLGDGGDATEAVAEAVDRTIAALVTDAVGAAEAALEASVAYAKERVQFGRPIGSFQAVQHLCADMLQAVELGRAAAYYALWACDATDPAERHRAATMAKAYASDAFPKVGAAAIQVHGGIGFTWEHDAHLFYKRLVSMEHTLGDAAAHLDELARIAL